MPQSPQEIESDYRLFADEYEKQARENSAVQALSHLSQNRVEIERFFQKTEDRLSEILRRSVKDEYLADPLSVIEYAYIKTETADNPLPSPGDLFAEDATFKEALGAFLMEDRTELAECITELTHSYFDRLYQLDAIDTVIEAILDYGYPENLLEGEPASQIQRKQKKRDHPLDPTADQEAIVEKVSELAAGEEYQYDDGHPAPTRIRDHIYRYYPEVCGGLSERQLYARVIWALQMVAQ